MTGQHTTSKGSVPIRKNVPIAPSMPIMLSKRANVLFIERARIVQKDGRVLWLSQRPHDDANDQDMSKQVVIEHYHNIPQHNTMLLLLGQGTSITDSAARLLADAGVAVGFVGSGGSPIHSAIDPMFLMPQSEYRPTEYMQTWMRMWLDDDKRLQLAKSFLKKRMIWTEESWSKDPSLGNRKIIISEQDADRFESGIRKSKSTEELLGAEAAWAKNLYAKLAKGYEIEGFTRDDRIRSRASTKDIVNGMITHGNYVAYGFSAVALYALGISFSLPLLHGKTRRGALVFDVADLFKDWTVLPLAFSIGCAGKEDQTFRNSLIEDLHRKEIVEQIIEVIKNSST